LRGGDGFPILTNSRAHRFEDSYHAVKGREGGKGREKKVWGDGPVGEKGDAGSPFGRRDRYFSEVQGEC